MFIDVDIERTKAYYSSLSQSELCDCDCCLLYYAKSAEAFPELSVWLHQYSADITKPFEAMSIDPDENGIVEYIGVQYVIFGACSEDFCDNVGEAEIRLAQSCPDTGIEEKHFVLEISTLRLTAD